MEDSEAVAAAPAKVERRAIREPRAYKPITVKATVKETGEKEREFLVHFDGTVYEVQVGRFSKRTVRVKDAEIIATIREAVARRVRG